jgi:hypothetical protein
MRANTATIATTAVYGRVAYHEPVKAEFHTAIEGARSVVLACAAPFIGLAFVVGLPFFGLGYLAWTVARLRFVKNVLLFILAPFVGLAYALAFPFAGIALLAWVGVRAALRRPAAR